MASYLPQDPSGKLTTEQLLSEAERLTGYAATPVQLRYLVAKGLLREAERDYPGRGHGRGSIAWWEAETLPRLVLILHARTGRRAKNISLEQAGRVLVIKGLATGYAPADAALLKSVLREYLADLKRISQLNRPFLKHPTSDVRQRFVDSVKRRNTGVTAAARDTLSELSASIVGLAGSGTPAPLRELSDVISDVMSIDALATALESATDPELLAAYADAGAFLGAGSAFLEMMTSFARSIYGIRDEGAEAHVTSNYTDRLPVSILFETADVLRPVATLVFIQGRHGTLQSLSPTVTQAASFVFSRLMAVSIHDRGNADTGDGEKGAKSESQAESTDES